jgi:nicotinate-nucleotide adenylyltransferase
MLHLALKNSPNMSVLDWEIKRPSPSYTLDTVIQAENTWPNTTLYWIMGSDQLPELQNWHEIELLKSKIIFLIYERLPYLINDYPFEGDYYPITGLALPEAATTIRNNIKNNNIDRLNLNKNVLNYIKKNQLYLK